MKTESGYFDTSVLSKTHFEIEKGHLWCVCVRVFMCTNVIFRHGHASHCCTEHSYPSIKRSPFQESRTNDNHNDDKEESL